MSALRFRCMAEASMSGAHPMPLRNKFERFARAGGVCFPTDRVSIAFVRRAKSSSSVQC